jgi:hypothetical protein
VLNRTRRNTNAKHANIGAIVAVAGLFALPLTAQAQGIAGGAAKGAQQGGEAAGPLVQRLAVQSAVLPAGLLVSSASINSALP